MAYYAGLRKENAKIRARIAAGLLRLRETIRAQKVPPRTLAGDVLIASWNIREFDSRKYGGRLTDAYYYIAEVLGHFDLVAVQEVREDLSALLAVKKILGRHWQHIVTDVTEGRSGNGERMAFLYDERKVRFTGLAGEIVLPPAKIDTELLQFARTPFVCGFQAGWAHIDLCTVHIYYGEGKPLDARRLGEIRKLADFLSARAKKADKSAAKTGKAARPGAPESRTLILLGDFNIFDPEDATLKAITDAGFTLPKSLADRSGSNMGKDKFYDQIAVWQGKRFAETPLGGVLDFYDAVFRDADEKTYAPLIKKTRSGNKPKYKEWKTYQMSDHLVLWSAFKVDFTDEYLDEIAKG